MLTKEFDYYLPQELIASRPLENRSDSRMLVLHRDTGVIEHRMFADFPSYMSSDDLLVLNDTKVIPARFFSDDQSIELLLINRVSTVLWECMVRPGKKMKLGRTVTVGGVVGEVVGLLSNGNRLLQWEQAINIYDHGSLALPHYMERSSDLSDLERYQTTFAKKEGAIAAPTAGLHFTEEILRHLNHEFLTLHVGIGTFRPVKAEKIEEHQMHSEYYSLSAEAAEKINQAARVTAVGTTCCRALETLGKHKANLTESSGETDIFIYPGFQFNQVDRLLTNFHLPKSTLIMLVSALAGKELTMRAYQDAVREKYRFYSYGDCMLIL